MASLPTQILIATAKWINQKLLQLMPHVFQVVGVSQPDFCRIVAVTQRQCYNTLGRHIIDKGQCPGMGWRRRLL